MKVRAVLNMISSFADNDNHFTMQDILDLSLALVNGELVECTSLKFIPEFANEPLEAWRVAEACHVAVAVPYHMLVPHDWAPMETLDLSTSDTAGTE